MSPDPVWLAVILAAVFATVVWTIDLFWMIWMRRGVFLCFGVLFWGSGSIIFSFTDKLELAFVGGFVAAVLILRLTIDTAYWLYDISRFSLAIRWPIRRAKTAGTPLTSRLRWPLVVAVVETAQENKERLADAQEPIWGYFRERMRVRQEIEYRARFLS